MKDHPNISFREDEDGYTRLTIRLGKSDDSRASDSLNILAKDGSDLCRINLFSNDDGSWGNVDTILLYGQKQGKFFAMSNGQPVVNETPENVTVYAVDIRDI